MSIFNDRAIVKTYDDNLLKSIRINYKNGATEWAFISKNDDDVDYIIYENLDKNGNGKVYNIESTGNINEFLDNLSFEDIENNNISFEVKMKNGKMNGKAYTYYPETGSIRQIDNMVNGKLNGTSIGYFGDGTEAFRIQYKNGKQIGHMVCSDGRRGRNLTCYNPNYDD